MTTDYGTARAAFRVAVQSASYSGWATAAKSTPLADIPVFGDMTVPDFINVGNHYASARALDLDGIVGQRIAQGLTSWPDLDELPQNVTELDYTVAMRAFMTAGGAVVSALCLTAPPSTRPQPDRSHWKRVEMSAPWSAAVLEDLAAAQAAARALAPGWVAYQMASKAAA